MLSNAPPVYPRGGTYIFAWKITQVYMNKIRVVRGFTLVELLIVMLILGLLASLIAPQMFGRVDSSRVQTAETQMRMLETALNTFRIDTGRFPENLAELRASEHSMWNGPYLPREVPMDPWGNAYVYRVPGEDGRPFALMSLGPEGQEASEDVIRN
ncbi:type II secretion system major pseudopilin GspG [Glaciecola punicea]|uniref:type II secretion system major pseudopilin GspG n=1 Tax=Glaciecola punicea TaxID=56804 RepID=UPI0009F7454A|nr:type II secretion system major pseudopilin GspG [Glaciecola punicea]